MYKTNRTPRGISTKVYPIPGYGYEVLTDLTEVVSVKSGRQTELTELSGKRMTVLQDSQNISVQTSQTVSGMGMIYRTHKTCRVRVIPGYVPRVY